jgi:hypothetical protein
MATMNHGWTVVCWTEGYLHGHGDIGLEEKRKKRREEEDEQDHKYNDEDELEWEESAIGVSLRMKKALCGQLYEHEESYLPPVRVGLAKAGKNCLVQSLLFLKRWRECCVK